MKQNELIYLNELPLTKERDIILKKILDKDLLLKYTSKGKPYIYPQTHDVSFSHKEKKLFLGISKNPFKIGIDLEKFDENLNEKAFIKFAFSKKEKILLKELCREKNISLSFGVSLLWSIKESFFKCIGQKIIPNSIYINSIKENNVKLRMSKRIREIMKNKGLTIKYTKFQIKTPYIYSITLMK